MDSLRRIDTLTYSLNIIISIERCADMAVKRAKIPFPVSIWKTNIYTYNFHKCVKETATMRSEILHFFICIKGEENE